MNGAIEKNLNEKGVLTLKLNRPEVLNAMNADLIMGLLECMNDAKSNKKSKINYHNWQWKRLLFWSGPSRWWLAKKQRGFPLEKLPLLTWKMPSIH